jgi:hypothetical protein
MRHVVLLSQGPLGQRKWIGPTLLIPAVDVLFERNDFRSVDRFVGPPSLVSTLVDK